MYSFIETNYAGILKTLREKKAFDDALRAEASKALDAFQESVSRRRCEHARTGGRARSVTAAGFRS